PRRHVSPNRVQSAVRQVDDAHNTVNEAQTAGDQKEYRGVEECVETLNHQDVHSAHCTPGWGGSQAILLGDAIGHHLDLRVDIVFIEVQGNKNSIEPGCEVPRQLDAEEAMAGVRGGASPHHGASRAQHHVATQRYLALFSSACGSPEWLTDDVISALETLDAFDVGLHFQSILTWSDLRHVGAMRQGVVIVGAYPQG